MIKPYKKNRISWRVRLSSLTIGLMTLLAFFAPIISPYDPTQMQTGISNHPPAWYKTPGKSGLPEHLLGTDLLGRDIFSHVIHGARAAMFLVLIAIPLALVIGVIVAVTAGLGSRFVETIFLRLTDVVSSVPSIMFTVILVFILRRTPVGQIFGGLITLALSFALVNWVGLSRLLYSSVIRIKHLEFMEASRCLGAGTFYQIFKHLPRHLAHLVIVWVVNSVPAVILLEALLGYIGIQILQVADGSSFQDLSWVGLILLGRTQINRNPFILLPPTLCILFISMSFSILGEYLNDRMNPQLESSQIL